MNESSGRGTLIVVPTFEERENLPRLIPSILEQSPDLEVLVVDDASPDGTGKVAETLAAAHAGRVFVLHREGKGGLGPAYLAGFRWAFERGYARIGQMDADLSHPVSGIPELLERSNDLGVDFVIGSRYVNGNVTVVNWPVGRLLVSLFGNLYARVVTGLPTTDATGGFNLFHTRVLMNGPVTICALTGISASAS